MSKTVDGGDVDAASEADKDWSWMERNARRLDFSLAQDGESWDRAKANLQDADIDDLDDDERWRVHIPGGDEHQLIIVQDDDDKDGYAGACDCDGYQYQPSPCAHLSVLALQDVMNDVVVRDETRAGELESDTVDAEIVERGADQEDVDGAVDEEVEPVDAGEATPVDGGRPQGPDAEDRPAPASTSPDPPETPSDPFAGELPDVDDQYVMTLGGDQYIRRAGYARMARAAGYRLELEEVVGAHETDWSHAKYRARILDEDGAAVANDVGSAHADAEDLANAEANLDELAATRAATRALSWATGEGITALAEVHPDQEEHQP